VSELLFSLLLLLSFLFSDIFIFFRDLRPENLFLSDDSYNARIKIIDFTSAIATRALQDDPQLYQKKHPFSNSAFSSPEVNGGEEYNHVADVWSFGIIVFFLLVGHLPFSPSYSLQKASTLNSIVALSFKEDYWKGISSEAKDFLSRCLTIDSNDRMTSSEALRHKWFELSEEDLSKDLLNRTVTELKRYQIRKKFRSVIKALILIIRIRKILKLPALSSSSSYVPNRFSSRSKKSKTDLSEDNTDEDPNDFEEDLSAMNLVSSCVIS
jgi:calcium/calmodulin-dependent protein kinase I